MRLFRWIGPGTLSDNCDLRRLGWQLDGDGGAAPRDPACPVLADRSVIPPPQWLSLLGNLTHLRPRLLLFGVSESEERARLIEVGVGDVVPPDASLVEIEARAQRIAERAAHGRLVIRLGVLRLELVTRDGFVAGRRLGLHPREFSLLWRLAQCPGEAVSARALIADVWRLNARPETNSLAVHVSRLRAKLRIAGLDGLLASVADGYRLDCGPERKSGLDLGPALFEERYSATEDRHECVTN